MIQIFKNFSTIFMVFLLQSCTQNLKHDFSNSCTIQSPPDSSGEEMIHGATIKIYPRLIDMSSQYSGCQTTWYPEKSDRLILNRVLFKDGKPFKYTSKNDVGTTEECHYNEKKLFKGSIKTCPAFETLQSKSLPSGCVARAMKNQKLPDDCKYE